MDPKKTMGLSDPLLKPPTMMEVLEDFKKYSSPAIGGTRTEAERIEIVTYYIDQSIDLMKMGPSPAGVKVLLELVQAREIMLANKEEIDGGR